MVREQRPKIGGSVAKFPEEYPLMFPLIFVRPPVVTDAVIVAMKPAVIAVGNGRTVRIT